jgi:hypothetical protein
MGQARTVDLAAQPDVLSRFSIWPSHDFPQAVLQPHFGGRSRCPCSHCSKSCTRTLCSTRGCLTTTVIVVRPPPISSTQWFSRNTRRPCATASYSEAAITSTKCSTPFRSQHDTVQVRKATIEHGNVFAIYSFRAQAPALRLAALPCFRSIPFRLVSWRFARINVAPDFAPAARGQKRGERRAKPLTPSGNGLHIARAIGENFG